VSLDAQGVGAVNTVKLIDGKWHGFNTDTCGFMEALLKDAKWNPSRKTIVVLGAGGAARACVYSLAQKNAKRLIVVNRTLHRAKRLVQDMQRLYPATDFQAQSLTEASLKTVLANADALIQTTSVGLKKTDPCLVPVSCWPKRKLLVMDLIYNPRQTPLLIQAKKQGYKTLDGLSMLLYQGVKAFHLWTGKAAPVEVMRRTLIQGLKSQ
jgi:shikimate dehydrogenase